MLAEDADHALDESEVCLRCDGPLLGRIMFCPNCQAHLDQVELIEGGDDQ